MDTKYNTMKMFENFFKNNLSIKKSFHSILNNLNYTNDQDSRVECGNNILSELDSVEFYFSKIQKDFDSHPEIMESVDSIISQCKDELINSSYAPNKMKQICNDYIFLMREDFVSKTKESCVGYSIFTSLNSLLTQSQSLNEVLHAIHSYSLNNEHLLQSMPKLDSKTQRYGDSITLYGIESPLARDIFDNFPTDSKAGVTDIVSLPQSDRVLMMVRDLGHALTLEIDTSLPEPRVNSDIVPSEPVENSSDYFFDDTDLKEVAKNRKLSKINSIFSKFKDMFRGDDKDISSR